MVSSPICTLLLLIRSTDTHYWNNATFGHLFCFLINLLFIICFASGFYSFKYILYYTVL